ncbi:hypothetical protein C2U55_30160 (plasmid) [Enterobacteriaceae bacterium ENNIH3]|nr:hypothetical protein C2U55_30160 [Enterobacteriaceae bacterium ENNIH3]AUV05068.1 hypothetical protein C2U52_01635 [Enterobacteriaceae bacterium ENNIH2]
MTPKSLAYAPVRERFFISEMNNNERVHTQCFFGHVDLTINLYCLRILFPGHLQGACRAVS